MPEKIEILCLSEGKVVGTLPVPESGGRDGGQVLTHRWVCANFQPVSSEYQMIAADQRDGEALRCPRCAGQITTKDAAFTPGEDPDRTRPRGATTTREVARAQILARYQGNDRALAFTASQGTPIVLGHSRIERRP
jgi:hypothetical protein